MTEHERKAWEAQLEKIWKPIWVRDYADKEWRIYNEECRYYAEIKEKVYLQIDETDGIYFFLNFHTEDDYLGCFAAYPDGNIEVGEGVMATPEEWSHITEAWLTTFRRCCWLSGLPLEATAHEKAEWMHGFNREELEAWDLKF